MPSVKARFARNDPDSLQYADWMDHLSSLGVRYSIRDSVRDGLTADRWINHMECPYHTFHAACLLAFNMPEEFTVFLAAERLLGRLEGTS